MTPTVTRETRETFRTPSGKPFFSRRAAFARHAWDLIRGRYFQEGELCTCSATEHDEFGRVLSDGRCFYHERSGYPGSSRNASTVERLHYRLTRWLMWRDRLFCTEHQDCRELPEMGLACRRATARKSKRTTDSATEKRT